jgi:CRISPR-associated protein Cmr5
MTLEQRRAAMAFGHVQQVSPELREQYGSMAQKLPVLLRTAGLCQALHFVKSRKKDPFNLLLDHLAEQMQRAHAEIVDAASLCKTVRTAELATYLWLSREALASAEWYARLAQSELGVGREVEARG